MFSWRILLLAGMTALLTNCGADPASPAATPISQMQGNSTNGLSLYNRLCSSCHGAKGTLSGNAAKEAKNNPDAAVNAILNGKGSMPGFRSQLTNQEVADILAHLKTL